jgi:hypothetical protein
MMTITMRGRRKCAIKGLGFPRKVPPLATFLPRLCFSLLPFPLILVDHVARPPLRTSFLYLLFVETSNQWTQDVVADVTKLHKLKLKLFVDCCVPHHCCPPSSLVVVVDLVIVAIVVLIIILVVVIIVVITDCACHWPAKMVLPVPALLMGWALSCSFPPPPVLFFMPCLPHLLHNCLPRPHTPADYHHHNWLIVVFYSHQLVLSKEHSKD